MSIFSKKEEVEVVLPYRVVEQTTEDLEAFVIDLEAYGSVVDQYQFFYLSLGFKAKYYDELAEQLKSTEDKSIKITAKVKNQTVKRVTVDFKYLAQKFSDIHFEKGDLYGYGINDHSAL